MHPDKAAYSGAKEASCYKVITCDINDEVVALQASLMIGVARQASLAQQKSTNHFKDKPLGILSEEECRKLIDALDRLQEAEERLHSFL